MSGYSRVWRRRSALSIIVLLASASLALAQTYYWRFELIKPGQLGDRHLIIGEIAATAQPNGSSATMAVPATTDYKTYWSSNIDAATGDGGVGNGGTNYQVTNIGSFSGSFVCAPGSCTSGNSNWGISTVTFYWTDASGSSYQLVQNGATYNVYNATFSNSTYTQGSLIGSGYTMMFQARERDPETPTGSFTTAQGFETGYGPNTFPEINASTLPRAALLLGSLLLYFRSRKER